LKAIVLDASVAMKWAIPLSNEALTQQALELLEGYASGEFDFIVPDVFWAEVGNVLWKGVRQRRWSRSVAETVAAEMRARNFSTISSMTLLPEALRIALAHDRSLYDCLYVALAIQSRTEMITADERLANALAAHLPVKWLGGFS
jgi:predicted nucleic acid-binding protein